MQPRAASGVSVWGERVPSRGRRASLRSPLKSAPHGLNTEWTPGGSLRHPLTTKAVKRTHKPLSHIVSGYDAITLYCLTTEEGRLGIQSTERRRKRPNS